MTAKGVTDSELILSLEQISEVRPQESPQGTEEITEFCHSDKLQQRLDSLERNLLVKLEDLLNESFDRQSRQVLSILQDKAHKSNFGSTQTAEGQNQSALSLPKPITIEDDGNLQNTQDQGPSGGASTLQMVSSNSMTTHTEFQIPSRTKIELNRQIKSDNYLQRIVLSIPFQATVVFMILLQSIVLGVEAENSMNSEIERLEKGTTAVKSKTHFVILEILCSVFFGIEILFRLAAWKRRFFDASDEEFFVWNVFDLIMFASLVLHAFEINSSVLRAVRMFRIARVLRIFRVLPKLRKMIYTLLRAAESMLPLIVMMFLTLYVSGLLFMRGGINYLEGISLEEFERQKAKDDMTTGTWIVINRFGSVMLTMRSLFASITGGDPWDWLFEPIMKNSILYSLVAVFFITFFIFAVMNVVTGVFVDEAMKVAAIDKDILISDAIAEAKATAEDINSFVSSVDMDQSGTVTREELMSILDNASVQRWLAGLDIDLDSRNAKRVLDVCDPYQTGEIDASTFCDLMAKLRGGARSIDLVLLSSDIKLLLRALHIKHMV